MISVEYIQHCGDDLMVVDAARVSFAKKSELECIDNVKGAYALKNKDERLIRYLAREDHKSPFNHNFVTMRIKAPIFVARQLQKHEYMPWNEVSRRYVDTDIELFHPEFWRAKAEDKKQGSGEPMELSLEAEQSYEESWRASLRAYEALLKDGVSPEMARNALPMSLMTEWIWSGTLFAWAKMCGLRLREDTQYESRLVAEKAEDVLSELFPVAWESLRMYAE